MALLRCLKFTLGNECAIGEGRIVGVMCAEIRERRENIEGGGEWSVVCPDQLPKNRLLYYQAGMHH